MYFIVNEERTNVPIEKLNPLLGYQPHYHPQGFSMINEAAVTNFTQNYGDILGVLKTLERGEGLIHVPTRKEAVSARIAEHLERVPTGHDEMQWRRIRLADFFKIELTPFSTSVLLVMRTPLRRGRATRILRKRITRSARKDPLWDVERHSLSS